VHANGDLQDFTRRSFVKQLSARYPQIEISDGYVSLSRDSSVVILGVMGHFLRSVYSDLDQHLRRDA
jgi:hypothetical protein